MDLKRAFDLLGIKKTSNLQHIKKAYHKKARKVHPDRHHTDPQKAEADFKELACAYEIAMDHSHKEINSKNPSIREPFKQNPPSSKEPGFSLDLTSKDIRQQNQNTFSFITDLILSQIRQFEVDGYQKSVKREQQPYHVVDLDSPFSSRQENHFDTCGNHDPYTVCLRCHSSP